MGFDWSVEIAVEYCQRVAIPRYLSRFTKRLIYFCDAVQAAHRCARGGHRETRSRKRRRLASHMVKLPGDDTEIADADYAGASEDEEDPFTFSDVPDELTDGQQELLSQLREECDSSHHPECDFDLRYNNPELISKAFGMAADRLLGEGHNVSLLFKRGGAYGEADEHAEEEVMALIFSACSTTPNGFADLGRGG